MPGPRPLYRPSAQFVGRRAELAKLAGLVRAHRLVTLVGPPGVGKTRLALRHLELQGRGRRSDVLLADLASARSGEDVCVAVRRLTAAGPADADATADAVGGALAARGPVVLVLDNVEQIVDEVAQLAARWLASAPDLRLLVTSREVLRLAAEATLEVRPLGVPSPGEKSVARILRSEAVKLLLARARIAVPSAHDAVALAGIARRLDGIPLALELAGSRLELLDPPSLLTRLSDSLDVLARGGRDASGRQSTLRAAVEWSFGLLMPWEQAALVDCSVFGSTFTVDAAEAIVDLSRYASAPPVLDVLQALRDKSLVADAGPVTGTPRALRYYHVVRQLAAEELARTGRAAAVRARLAAYYADRASRRIPLERWSERHARRRALLADVDNLLAALDASLAVSPPSHGSAQAAATIALALDELELARAPADTHRDRLAAALVAAISAGLAPDVIVRLRVGLARVLIGQGGAAAAEQLDRALELAAQCGDPRLEALVLTSLGRGDQLQGRLDAAQARFLRALTLLDASDRRDSQLEVELRLFLAALLRARGEATGARQEYDRAGALAAALADPEMEARVLSNAVALSEPREGVALLQRALALWTLADNRRGEAFCLANLAWFEQEVGRHGDALRHNRQALARCRPLGETRLERYTLGNLGALHLERGDHEAARAALERALAMHRAAGELRMEALVLGRLAVIAATGDRLATAEQLLTAARTAFERAGDRTVARALALHHGHLDLARWRRAVAAGDAAGATRHGDAATGLLAGPAGASGGELSWSDDVRFEERLLARALASCALLVSPTGAWFQAPNRRPVRLDRRPLLARLLDALARARIETPGQPVPLDRILAHAWPGERILAHAASNRVKVSMSLLRKAGLGPHLRAHDGGYLLDPTIPLLWTERPTASRTVARSGT